MPARIDPTSIPVSPDLSFESAFWSNHITLVAGLDEAGRGAWAGPVVAAAVILPCRNDVINTLAGVRDSKQLSPEKRAILVPVIKSASLSWGVGYADNLEIDRLGILPATRLAMSRALQELTQPPDSLLLDALFLPDDSTPQTSLIKGDQRSLSVAAASILAKTARDEWMVSIHEDYPIYGFDQHKGYGTRLHHERLKTHGRCALHRVTYKPVSAY